MSDIGMVNTIQALEIVETTQPSIIEFEIKYSAYKELVTRLKAGRPASNQITHALIRQCIKPEIFQSMCILGYIEGATKAEEATDETVKNGLIVT